jgi:hypothetical protein
MRMTAIRRTLSLSLLALLVSTGADANPVLDYSSFALNFSDVDQQFSLDFFTPYAGGPYNTLTNEFSSTITDLIENGTASAVPVVTLMSNPSIDGADIAAAGLGSGCTLSDTPGFSLPCDALTSTSASVATFDSGMFGVVVSFTLSPGDALEWHGRLELSNTSVPEPLSVVLLGTGIGAAVLRRRSRQRT